MKGVASAHGGCLCGGVRYAVSGPLRDVIACHCSQCRRTSGHYAAATEVHTADLVVTQSATLRWYRSSGHAERGFCSRCGSNLFWRQLPGSLTPAALPTTRIAAGTLQQPTGVKLRAHRFVADKSDYYDIADDLPHADGWAE